MSKSKVYVLLEGSMGDDRGFPVAVFTTKKALRNYVRAEYAHARGEQRKDRNELYWRWDWHPGSAGGWLSGEEVDFVSNTRRRTAG